MTEPKYQPTDDASPTDAAGHTWSLQSALRLAEEHVAKLAELMAAADKAGA